jgi:hypothetical protein
LSGTIEPESAYASAFGSPVADKPGGGLDGVGHERRQPIASRRTAVHGECARDSFDVEDDAAYQNLAGQLAPARRSGGPEPSGLARASRGWELARRVFDELLANHGDRPPVDFV